MSEFWIAAIAMIAVALMLALPPFLRPRPPAEDTSRRENIAAARKHLREIQERALPEKESEEYETEIKTRLWEEAGAAAAPEKTKPSADKIGAIVVCIALLFGAPLLYAHLGAPFVVSAAPQMPDLQTAIAGLQKHIAENPEDVDALMLMGRTLTAIGREKEAAEYFARASAILEETERAQN